MKKILYLSYDGLTDPLGQSQILPYLLGLAKKGNAICIISAEKKSNYSHTKTLIEEKIAQSEGGIEWHPIFYTKTPPVFSTLYDLWKMKKKANQLQRKNKFDIIHCRSYLTALIGLSFKQHYGVRFIFDMRGFWADERVEGGIWNLNNPIYRLIYRFFKKKETEFLHKADYTISLTENAKKEINNWNIDSSPIQVIPCCVDTELFDYRKYDIPKDNFTLSYLGSLGTWYLLDEMLVFYKNLLLYKPESNFLFITKDSPELILGKAKKYQLPLNQIQIQAAAREEVPALLAKSNLAIFFIKDSFSKKASSATKMGEILGMGIPIIANKGVGDHDFLFENYVCGALLPIDSLKDGMQSIDNQLIDLPFLLSIPKESLRKTALDYFSLEKGVALYQEVYESL